MGRGFSYANVTATLALVLALTSPVWADPVAHEAASVGSQAKKALKLGKGADKRSKTALATAKRALGRSAQPGARGPEGLQGAQGSAGERGPGGSAGPQGNPGSALAFAHVDAVGSLDSANSKNVIVASSASPGVFCLIVTTAQAPRNVVATLDLSAGGLITDQIRATLDPLVVANNCGGAFGSPNALVGTANAAGTSSNRAFYVTFN